VEGGGYIEIATVRPETVFADQAIAVHPEDERYQAFIGKKARIPSPTSGSPYLADPAVEREFGTGALKVTPAHDPLDYEIGERHGLTPVSVINLEGRMEGERVPEPLRGLDRFEARKKAVALFQEGGPPGEGGGLHHRPRHLLPLRHPLGIRHLPPSGGSG
jgi:valyl-tRNA synthetase